MTPKQFSRGGRRSGTRIEKGNRDLTARKRLVQNGQIPDYQRQEAKTETCFNHRKKTAQRRCRSKIAEPERNQRRAAHIKIISKTIRIKFAFVRNMPTVINQGKPDHQPYCPEAQQQ